MNKINICGLLFDNVTMDEAVSFLLERISRGEVAAVVTPNAEIAMSAMESPDFCRLLNQAELMIPDGIGVIRAAEILKTPLKGKVAGIELGENMLREAALANIPVFFLGGKPGVGDEAAAKMSEKYKGLRVVGVNDGYFKKEGAENDAVIDKINKSGARILYVCIGSPAQEKWIFANRERMPEVSVCLALGGSLDGYAGRAKRAPKFMIKLGLEWLWRVIREPSRIGRIWKLRKFLSEVKKYARAKS